MKRSYIIPLAVTMSIILMGNETSCSGPKSSDEIQREQQESILKEGSSQIGMPAIKNFRDKRLLKDILEDRDQSSLTTYSYLWSDIQGKLIFFCNSIGYGIPYATQFTNPQKYVMAPNRDGVVALPQADPNGLFSPASAQGTWVMCKDPNGSSVKPVFIEPNIIVSPFRLEKDEKVSAPVSSMTTPR